MDDELLNLTRDIAAIDGDQAAPGIAARQEVAEADSLAKQSAAAGWAEIPSAVGIIVMMVLPECKDAFREEACLEWGKHAAKVAEKHGWNTDGLPPEVSLILASLGFVLPVGLAYKARKIAPTTTDTEGQSHGQATAKG